MLFKTSLILIILFLSAGVSAGGQTLVKGGWWADKGGVWVLEQEEESMSERLSHSCRQTGEAWRLQHQWLICGLQAQDREDADTKGKRAVLNNELALLMEWQENQFTHYTYPQNRKNDEASYEKMLKLRRDLSRAVTILEMIKRREKSKRELLHLTLEIVEKRCTWT